MKKNIILMKRNYILTLFEIFFPILMFILIIVLRNIFTIDYYEFDEKEINTDNYIKNKSIVTISSEKIIRKYGKDFYGMQIIPPFQICSKYNFLSQERPLIASINIPLEIKLQMINDSLIYKEILEFSLSLESFKEFSSIEEMENYIKSPDYNEYLNGLICFGLSFSYNLDNNKYDYSLHFFDKIDIPNNSNGLFNKYRTEPDLNSFLLYQNGAYSYMIKIVNEYILRKELKSNNAELNYAIIPMKYTDYRIDSFGDLLGFIISIIILLAYMAPLSLYVFRIVGEKETKIKETMKIMGLSEGEYFLSYFIQYIIISFFVSLINALLFKCTFKHIPFHFLFFSILLWAFDIFSLVYFFQSFIDKKRISLILSLVIYFIMFCLSLICVFGKKSLALKVILSIFPPVGLNIGILLFSKFEVNFKYFYNKDFLINYDNYSIGIMYLMFIIDFILYLFLGFYLNNVLPHEIGIQSPWYFLFTKKYWNSFKKKKKINTIQKMPQNNLEKNEKEIIESNTSLEDKNLYNNSSDFENEEIYNNKYNKRDILKIRNIVKKFEDGKVAVNGVNLNLYKDEIFALLGQNGAGKTTLISMLTGIYQATSGYIIYKDINILNNLNMDIFREKIGICPQHDILFDNLNVREHLEMFSIFKGVESKKVNLEINKVLKDFQLEDIQYMIVKNLSAGQRRKISIALAIIGGSEVIFLDEPSSGMDISSRRNLWEILKYQSKGKIIILTTHYMEEASVLGKRIGIINLGKLKCLGSPLFLIEKFGKYMTLNVTKEKKADNKIIIDFISKFFTHIKYEVLHEEILFRIQIKGEDLENQENKNEINLSNFFKKFDEQLSTLKIKTYNVSMPTLEDAFLNIISNNREKLIKQNDKKILIEENQNSILFNTILKENFPITKKFISDFNINMKRRFLIAIRDIKSFIIEILCPFIIVLIGLGIANSEMNYFSYPELIDISIIGNQKILYASLLNNNKVEDYFITNINNIKNEIIEEFDYFKFQNNSIAIKYFVDMVYYKSKDSENSLNHEIDMTTDKYIGYYASLLMLEEKDNKYEFIMLLNTRVSHCIPIYSHYLLKSIIEKTIKKRIDINFTHYPMPLTDKLKEISNYNLGNKIIIVFFIGVALSLQPINFISLLVRERNNNSKHLMRISGINIVAYWIANYIFEIIKYYFTYGICLVILYFFDFYKKHLYIFYLVYGPGMISLTYSLSFFFLTESSSQNIIIIIYFVLGDLSSIIVYLIRIKGNLKTITTILQYFFGLNPLFCFNYSFNILLNYINLFVLDYPNEWVTFKEDEKNKKILNLIKPMIIYSSIECFLYTLLLIILESKSYSYPSKKTNQILNENNENDDKDKSKEINIYESSKGDLMKNNKKNKNILLNVKNLQKIYKSGFCNKENHMAVKNINFSLDPAECFGFLGFSGAGKTTTFKCITQELPQDKGEILVKGENISGNLNKLQHFFGYCPQFNAIFEHLTVYENLEFYARIKGMNHNSINTLVRTMIKEMSLKEFKDKISKNLSGGNKRKLSVAISILCNPPIILLDEPATGIDPEARHSMWSIIHRMSTKGKSSVIMSTHSMNDAETLCKRLGIIIDGEFVFYGNKNEIKEKYGKGYEINIRIKPIDEKSKNSILNNIDKNTLVNSENLEIILKKLNKDNYYGEFKNGKIGEKIYNYILNKSINIEELIEWFFFVENALKFIDKGKNYFDKIILLENFDNAFLFKIEKNNKINIGFIFGTFEESKEECFVSEYSIKQTSLEQIFIKLSNNKNQENEIFDKGIIIDHSLLNNLVNNEKKSL